MNNAIRVWARVGLVLALMVFLVGTEVHAQRREAGRERTSASSKRESRRGAPAVQAAPSNPATWQENKPEGEASTRSNPPEQERSREERSPSTRQTDRSSTREGRVGREERQVSRDRSTSSRGATTSPDNPSRVEQRRDRVVPQGRYTPGRVQVRDRGHYYYHPRYPHRKVYYRPRIHIDLHWPWEHRYRHHWSPRYRYRQVVYINVGWGGGRHHRDGRIEVETWYRQRVRHADGRYAEVDITLERIDLYRDGRYIGQVDHIPDDLGHIRATIYRNGRVSFSRDVFLLGDLYTGFEMISTRHYDGYVLDRWHRSHDLRVGVLDLRRERVYHARHSRLFNPYDFNGHAPISLLPDDQDLLWDYGTVSYYDDDYYYEYDYDDGYGGDDYGDGGYYAPRGDSRDPRSLNPAYRGESGTTDRAEPNALAPPTQSPQPLRRQQEQTFNTGQGATIRMQRQTEIQRVE
jgi:hypothetical protein